MTKISYTFGKAVPLGYDEALQRVTAALANQGFGVLTEIDVAATIKKKLGKDMAPYKILGACNPQFAHRHSSWSRRSAHCCPATS
jgi:uncharacterized protein (DUF302 family)